MGFVNPVWYLHIGYHQAIHPQRPNKCLVLGAKYQLFRRQIQTQVRPLIQ